MHSTVFGVRYGLEGVFLTPLTSSRPFANCTLLTELVNTVSLLDLLTDTLTFRARWCCRRIRGRHESPSTDCSHRLTFDIRGGNLRTGRNEMCGAITTIEQQVGVGSQDIQPMRGCALPASPVEVDLKGEFIKVAVCTKNHSHRRAV